jgi:hypothetical protein
MSSIHRLEKARVLRSIFVVRIRMGRIRRGHVSTPIRGRLRPATEECAMLKAIKKLEAKPSLVAVTYDQPWRSPGGRAGR